MKTTSQAEFTQMAVKFTKLNQSKMFKSTAKALCSSKSYLVLTAFCQVVWAFLEHLVTLKVNGQNTEAKKVSLLRSPRFPNLLWSRTSTTLLCWAVMASLIVWRTSMCLTSLGMLSIKQRPAPIQPFIKSQVKWPTQLSSRARLKEASITSP